MKSIDNYISEKLNITADNIYAEYPETKEELQNIIIQYIKRDGPKCNLNNIDVSNITDMSDLFYNYTEFNCDISEWDVSNVKDMSHMFYRCYNFNQNLSQWDVRQVENMDCMFYDCGRFNGNLSDWNTCSVTNMNQMFGWCSNFDKNLSKWAGNVKRVTNMNGMFEGCDKFNGADLEKWDVNTECDTENMFLKCKSAPAWYKGDL